MMNAGDRDIADDDRGWGGFKGHMYDSQITL